MSNWKLNLFLGVLAALLLAIILFWERDGDSRRERREQARRALYFDVNRVTGIAIETPDIYIQCQRDGKHWRLTQPMQTRASAVVIERLLSVLQELPRNEIIIPTRSTLNPLRPYGLDEPRAAVHIGEGSRTNTIFIGRRAPLGDGIYIRQTDQQGIVRTTTDLLNAIPTNPAVLRDKTLIDTPLSSIQRLDIRGGTGFIQLVRDESGNWKMRQPVNAAADTIAIGVLLDQLLSSRIQLHIQDQTSDISPYGLDSSAAITLIAGGDSGAATHILTLGDPLTSNPELVYARLQAENSIIAVPATLKTAFNLRPVDVLDHRLPEFNPDTLQHLSIREGEQQIEFKRDNIDAPWRMVAPYAAPIEEDILKAQLRILADLRIQQFHDPGTDTPHPAVETGADAPPAAPPPPPRERTLHYTPHHTKPLHSSAHSGAGFQFTFSHHDGETNTHLHFTQTANTATLAGTTIFTIPLDPLAYRSRQILSIPRENLLGLQIQIDGEDPILLLRPSNTPDAALAPAAASQELLAETHIPLLEETLRHLHAEQLIQDPVDNPAEYGLDTPVATFTLNLSGEHGYLLALQIGDTLPDSASRYAIIRGRPLLFSLSETTLQALTLESP